MPSATLTPSKELNQKPNITRLFLLQKFFPFAIFHLIGAEAYMHTTSPRAPGPTEEEKNQRKKNDHGKWKWEG